MRGARASLMPCANARAPAPPARATRSRNFRRRDRGGGGGMALTRSARAAAARIVAAASETVSTNFERIAPAGARRRGRFPRLSSFLPRRSKKEGSVDRSIEESPPSRRLHRPLTLPPSLRPSLRPFLHPLSTADGAKTIVALGKFDAMHRGHARLAAVAAGMGAPYLVSFGGMAEVLGWTPTLPVVATEDRERVCELWRAEGLVSRELREHAIPFAAIRRMSPEEFVKTLKDIGVGGVVAGRNYRFGFKAAGTADTLVDLGEKLDVDVSIVDLLPADIEEDFDCPGGCTPQVSSTRVRACLAAGDVEQCNALLGRPHRLVMSVDDVAADVSFDASDTEIAFALASARNQYPAPGVYAVRAAMREIVEIAGPEGDVRRGAPDANAKDGRASDARMTVSDADVVLDFGVEGVPRELSGGVGGGGGEWVVCVDIISRA